MALVELGPGRGTLMKDALRATRHVPGFHAAIQIHLVEVSQKLEQVQRETLAGAHPHIHWHRDISSLPQEKPWLVVANEFLDALPIRQFVLRDGRPHERCIGARKDALCMVEIPVDLPSAISTLREGEIAEFCEPVEAVIAFLASHIGLHGGAALMVDYGYNTPVRGDTLQAVKKHQFDDVLTAPGEADITAHVNFLRLADVASAQGTQVFLSTQGHFLLRLGAAERAERLAAQNDKALAPAIYSGVQRLVADDAMGALFKVMAITTSNEAPPGF